MSLDFKGRHNIYHCTTCRRQVVTIDRDAGTTPMAISCRQFGGDCPGQAHSAYYPSGAQQLDATHEWYAPTVQERNALKRHNERELLDHVMMGGLLVRRIGDATTG